MKNEYCFKVVYEKLPNGGYQAWVPMLPACQAKGGSLTQVRARIQEAIQCYCLNMMHHGAPIPQTHPGLPVTVEEVQISVGAV